MRKPPVAKETLHKAIRAAVAANGGKRISYDHFLTVSGLRPVDVRRNYPRWEEAMCGAGFKFQPYLRQPGLEVLLAEWGEVVRKLGRLPACYDFNIHAPRVSAALSGKVGGWNRVPAAFRRFAGKDRKWADVIALIDFAPRRKTPRRAPASVRAGCQTRPRFIRKARLARPASWRPRRVRPRSDRLAYGDQLDLPSMRHAPSSELGVVYLFGIMAASLGFAVERMQSTFPDCLAKRRIFGGKWQSVAIEFEYESRNFHSHRHDPAQCDIIICWVHNWPDCPKHIEVIELSKELKRFTENKMLQATGRGD